MPGMSAYLDDFRSPDSFGTALSAGHDFCSSTPDAGRLKRSLMSAISLGRLMLTPCCFIDGRLSRLGREAARIRQAYAALDGPEHDITWAIADAATYNTRNECRDSRHFRFRLAPRFLTPRPVLISPREPDARAPLSGADIWPAGIVSHAMPEALLHRKHYIENRY